MIYSQPNREELNSKSLSEAYTLMWKVLASRELPEAASRFPRVNIQNKNSNILFAPSFALVKFFEQNKQNMQQGKSTMDRGQIVRLD